MKENQNFFFVKINVVIISSSFRLSRDQSGYNFDFRLLYKVLPRETAVVRFGGIRREGKLLSFTYYDVYFELI